MAEVKFTGSKQQNKTTFNSLPTNASFTINSPHSRGAVYRKIEMTHNTGSNLGGNYYMLEEATGKVFSPTLSNIKEVEVEVNVKCDKPSCY